MMPRLTTLRTMTQYSLARMRVLRTMRTLWSALTICLILVLAVIGTSAAWRARTSSEELPPAEATFAVSPLAELVPQSPAAPALQETTTAPSAVPTPLRTATDTAMVTHSAGTHGPVTTTTSSEEPAQRVDRQPERTPQHDRAMRERACTSSEQRTASVQGARHPDVNADSSRLAPRAPVPALPRVRVVSVSSTAVLVQHGGQRQIIRRGARLNGWTLARLTPIGITLQRAQHQAMLPLSFDARVSSNR